MIQSVLSRASAARFAVSAALAITVFAALTGPAAAFGPIPVSEARRFVGTSDPWTSNNITVCPPAQASDFESQRFVPGWLQGFFRLDWTLYKDGQQIMTDRQDWDETGQTMGLQNYTFTHMFFGVPTTPGSYTTELTIRKRNGPPWNRNFNEHILVETSHALVISNVTPVPSFKILNSSNVFVSPPADGSAIPVSLSNGIVMNASATTCTTAYDLIVQESNQWWDRPLQHEWSKWFLGQAPPAAMNIQQLTTTYSPTDGTGYFSLIGGNFIAGSPAQFIGQPRYYRIGFQPAGAPWNPKMALIQVGW